MNEDTVISMTAPAGVDDPLTELIQDGARRLIAAAVQGELDALLAHHDGERMTDGRARVVRNGFQPERKIVTGIGQVPVKIPKVRAREGEPVAFRSELVPPYIRRTATLDTVLPWLYLRGISTGQMKPALEALVGPEAKGFSPNVVSRLKRQWDDEYAAWSGRSLDDEWVYVWADGIHSGLRGDDGKLCTLVVIGVNSLGKKHFLAIEDGVRESTQSWREVLLGMKHRGLTRPPKLAVGDGAMGFWAALSEVYPETTPQRCWQHKAMNVMNYLPKSAQGKARSLLNEISMAETKEDAERAFDHWLEVYAPKYPKAADCLVKDRDSLMAFFDFPAAHWTHIRTTNVIESSFATIRHRSKRAKGCVTRKSMLSMIYKMAMCAESTWRRLRGFNHLAQVIAGVEFKNGVEVTEQRKVAA